MESTERKLFSGNNQDRVQFYNDGAVSEKIFVPKARLMLQPDGRPLFHTITMNPAKKAGDLTAIDFVSKLTQFHDKDPDAPPSLTDLKSLRTVFKKVQSYVPEQDTPRFLRSGSIEQAVFRRLGLPHPTTESTLIVPDYLKVAVFNVKDFYRYGKYLTQVPPLQVLFDVSLDTSGPWPASDPVNKLFMVSYPDIVKMITANPVTHFYKQRENLFFKTATLNQVQSMPLDELAKVALWSKDEGNEENNASCSYYLNTDDLLCLGPSSVLIQLPKKDASPH